MLEIKGTKQEIDDIKIFLNRSINCYRKHSVCLTIDTEGKNNCKDCVEKNIRFKIVEE